MLQEEAAVNGACRGVWYLLLSRVSRSCWETSALLCTCCLGLGLTQPSKACGRRPGHVAGQPWVPGVSVQKRVTLTSDSIL